MLRLFIMSTHETFRDFFGLLRIPVDFIRPSPHFLRHIICVRKRVFFNFLSGGFGLVSAFSDICENFSCGSRCFYNFFKHVSALFAQSSRFDFCGGTQDLECSVIWLMVAVFYYFVVREFPFLVLFFYAFAFLFVFVSAGRIL